MTQTFMIAVVFLFYSITSLACPDCGHDGAHGHKAGHEHEHKDAQKQSKKTATIKTFGANLNKDVPKVELAALLKDPKQYLDKTVQTKGQVEKICEKSGCWLSLKNADQKIHVTFKDYGFFVPTEIVGKDILIEGQVSQKKSLQFIANGVEVLHL